MSLSASQLNRFLVSSKYSIYYRRLKKLLWTNTARPEYGVLYLFQGRLKFAVGSNAGELLQDQALLIEPSVNVSASGQGVEILLLNLSPAFVTDHAVTMRLIGAEATVGFPQALVEKDNRLIELAHDLAAELGEDRPGQEIVIQAAVQQTVVLLLRHYSNMRHSPELELSRVGLVDRRIRRSVELIHSQLDQDLSLKAIADASYPSPFHFSRLFKKLTGTTPHAYLAGIRTTHAQSLLADESLSVTEISSRVGYASPSHFTKAFRDATGLTPRAFRKALITR